MKRIMARKAKINLNDRVLSSKWPGHVFIVVMIKDGRYAIENDKVRTIATITELTKIK